ncbi:MAG: FadR family transcriptional regulator [Anaerolineae bacterium]|nr:FadR family transcriptional regulator [Anaerolineae bacterium]
MQPLRGPALNTAVREYVKQYILENNLGPGDPLPTETELASELGVGRSSVREAIKSLQSLGIIEVRHGNGTFVREYNFDPMLELLLYSVQYDKRTLLELHRIREWLELAVMREVIEKITDREIEQLEALMGEWENCIARAKGDVASADIDARFHEILHSTLKNQTLLNLFQVFWMVYRRVTDPSIADPEPETTIREHRALLEAVRVRDPDDARRWLRQSASHGRDRIRRAVEASENGVS